MRVTNLVGTRPNLVKMAPLVAAERRAGLIPRLVNTGQHLDPAMSHALATELGLPPPDVQLKAGAVAPSNRMAYMVAELESEFSKCPPDVVVVVGDVDSTAAAAIAAHRRGLPVAHVEAGLRSGDLSMPEEVNRIVTDALSRIHLASEPSAVVNLLVEGHAAQSIRLVGNVMIDTLVQRRDEAALIRQAHRMGLPENGFALVTLHRPANVDDPRAASAFVDVLAEVGHRLPVAFPVHPRARSAFIAHGRYLQLAGLAGITVLEPQSYLQMLSLTLSARVVLTDSGGLQEESSFVGTPCLTLRDNTERPITVTHGTNRIAGREPAGIISALDDVLSRPRVFPRLHDIWDGHAAVRVVEALMEFLERAKPSATCEASARDRILAVQPLLLDWVDMTGEMLR